MSKYESPLYHRLIETTPLTSAEFDVLIDTAPFRYKIHWIDKRGGRGRRLIAQPTREIKYLQRKLIAQEFLGVELSPAAVGYRTGRSIRDHAAPHGDSRYLLKLDFKDFFPSLDEHAIRTNVSRDFGFSETELQIVLRILCRHEPERRRLELSIGAPSSPFMSNYIMREFDSKVLSYCKERAAIYTRYADDIAISTNIPKDLDFIEKDVRRILDEIPYLGLRFNEEKKVNVSKKRRRTLVGLTLGNDGKVSIGRDEKRRLRAALFQLSRGETPPEGTGRIRGRMAFIYSIDPEFVREACERYGFASISEICKRDSDNE